MAFTLLKPTGIDLSQTFAFTGGVTGDNSGGLVRVGGGASESANTGNLAFDNVFSALSRDLSASICPCDNV